LDVQDTIAFTLNHKITYIQRDTHTNNDAAAVPNHRHRTAPDQTHSHCAVTSTPLSSANRITNPNVSSNACAPGVRTFK
jgi:hypothetical protein